MPSASKSKKSATTSKVSFKQGLQLRGTELLSNATIKAKIQAKRKKVDR
jgi:hypothetical protein